MTIMTTTTTTNAPTGSSKDLPKGHHWETAGEAWGSHANDWATLFEHYSLDVVTAISGQLDLGSGTTLLDVACGSGWALRLLGATGATTAGLDAAANLVDVAAGRNPECDLRVGTMFDLPWDDESFDVVTSINGIWGDCGAALDEAYRVLRPGGSVAISFWGPGQPLDLLPVFIQFARHAPPDHVDGMRRTNDIARPGVAEQMLEDAGFESIRRDSRISTLEWPDLDTAWRALASVGPAQPALAHSGADVVRPFVEDALADCLDRSGMYRFRNDHQFVIARKPASAS